MRAAVVEQHGGPDVLQIRQLPDLQPGSDQVLVEVEAAGVAYADVLMRRGLYPETPHTPFTPGYDVVGRVLAVGEGVDAVGVGTRVAALTVVGGCATRVLAAAELVVPIPEDVPAPQVCALVLNYVTAHQLLHRVARVHAGQTVLVLGAAGGVGTALLELAALAGISTIGTASGARTAAVTARGGVAVDRRTHDVVTEVRRCAPGGVTAVFDPVGGPSLAVSRSMTAPGGVIASYGVSFAVDEGRSRLSMLARQGIALGRAKLARSERTELYVIAGWRGRARKHPDHFREDLTSLVRRLAAGDLAPEVVVLALDDAAEAHRALEAGEVTGKLVLVP